MPKHPTSADTPAALATFGVRAEQQGRRVLVRYALKGRMMGRTESVEALVTSAVVSIGG